MIRSRLIAGTTIAFCTVIALSTLASGIDYFADCLGIDALIRGDFHDFFVLQPMQGPASMLLRAPFVALVFHSDIATVYYAGLIPCYAALLVLARVLWARTQARPTADRLAIVALVLGSPFVVKAVHWGHPEDLLATALVLGSLLVALRGKGVLAGVMLGTAYASKQWAVVAGLPILLALPHHRGRFFAACCGTALLFVVPMVIGDPERFWLVTRDAGRAVPGLLLEHSQMPHTRVLPHSVWTLFASERDWGGHHYRYTTPLLMPVAHPLMVLAGVPLAYKLWRRGPVDGIAATRLLVLVLALRSALDPNDLDYYQVPLVGALAVLATLGGRRELDAALYVTAGLALAFVQPATMMDTVVTHTWLKFAVYMATMVPLIAWLVRDLYFAGARELYRARRSPRAQASASSA